jgi:hypothetical protein
LAARARRAQRSTSSSLDRAAASEHEPPPDPPVLSLLLPRTTGILAGGHGGHRDFSFGSTGFASSSVSISAAWATKQH